MLRLAGRKRAAAIRIFLDGGGGFFGGANAGICFLRILTMFFLGGGVGVTIVINVINVINDFGVIDDFDGEARG